jgi:type IV pilus assembly protein PilW
MRKQQRGFSIIELLVALTIGTVLIGGAVYVYSQSRRTSMVTDSVARLQENGRYVFSVIEPDLQLAGYYGYSNQPYNLKFISGGTLATPITAINMGQGEDKTAVPGLGDAQKCGKNFAVDVISTVEGSQDKYPFDLAKCPPLGGGYQLATDTLTIRRSGMPPTDGIGVATNGTIQLLANRLSPSNEFIFADGKLPSDPKPTKNLVQVRDLVVRTYYISVDSTNPAAKNLPALRVKALTSGPTWDDQEVMRGVEDLQVQFGIDTGDYNGDEKIDAGLDEDGDGIPDDAYGIATRYVDPDKLPVGFQVVSVRIWVLLRAETPEQGFVNKQDYTYAGKTYKVNDNFRRVLMSRTIQLRNTRVL